ncbi:MAG: amidohydrolase family protein [Candidatus Latescibacterota bacterium]
MIVDCHTHWGIVWEDRDRGDPGRWLEVLDRHGVDRAFVLGHYNLQHSEAAARDNDRLAGLRDKAPERIVPFGTSWPQQGPRAVEEARRCLETLGMAGLKFHPWLQGFSTADAAFAEICAMAGEHGALVLLHDGTPCYSLSEQVGGLARRFPGTRFVLGHAGLLWGWRSALEAARQPNVWVCVCGPHLRAMEAFCQRVPAERLLWGTDFGFGFADPIDYRLGLIRRACIDPGLRERILGENPRRLLGEAWSR